MPQPTSNGGRFTGRPGLTALLLAVVTWLGLSWMAWIGAPVRAPDGSLAVKRGRGMSARQVSAPLWWASAVVAGLSVAGALGFAGCAVCCARRDRSRRRYERSFAKAILVVFVLGFLVAVAGLAAQGVP